MNQTPIGRHSPQAESRTPLFGGVPGLSLVQKLEMLEQLGSQDTLEQMLQQFAQWVGNMLPISSLSYSCQDLEIELLNTSGTVHELVLKLQDPKGLPVGQLKYGFRNKLTPYQQRVLMQLQNFIVVPLRLYLRLEKANLSTWTPELISPGHDSEFNKALSQAIHRNQRTNQGLCLMLIQLDGIANIDSDLTLSTIEQILTEFIELMLKTARRSDQLYQLSEDRFALLMSPASQESSINLSERIHNQLSHYPTLSRYHIRPIIGASIWSSGQDDETLYLQAEEGLNSLK
ncbi:diguanylate cyclase domain-containing protein [Dongshaea marina]|uniref:diguanylate cyclase domain-containing protein n=1 Tax=Dongshaea marina TaxID=2047966 RepID=UPI000D3E4E53|nr:diguanylate cyclase [Dongshaea marina]